MMVRVRGPWAWSLGLHGLVAALVLGWWSGVPEDRPPVVRMRLVSPPGVVPSDSPSLGRWWTGPQVAPAAQGEPTAPLWSDLGPTPVSPSTAATVPFRLDELLAGLGPSAEAAPEVSPAGWSSEGQGYALPPLPPPRLAPPQGARWSLVLKVGGAGGYASVEGLDSGHPELDQWLEAYLRTVVFPPSLDGGDYELRWALRLESGRPQ